jgi:hypothetical protein
MKLWDNDSDLWLLTPEEFAEVPDNIVLLSISDEPKVKGQDYIDDDTRFGVLAYGLTPAMAESQGIIDKFIFWKLRS